MYIVCRNLFECQCSFHWCSHEPLMLPRSRARAWPSGRWASSCSRARQHREPDESLSTATSEHEVQHGGARVWDDDQQPPAHSAVRRDAGPAGRAAADAHLQLRAMITWCVTRFCVWSVLQFCVPHVFVQENSDEMMCHHMLLVTWWQSSVPHELVRENSDQVMCHRRVLLKS